MRAVGAANGRNPLPIVLPCHRVIGADGSLTGFGGGLPTKQFLLALEGALPASDGPVRQPADGQQRDRLHQLAAESDAPGSSKRCRHPAMPGVAAPSGADRPDSAGIASVRLQRASPPVPFARIAIAMPAVGDTCAAT